MNPEKLCRYARVYQHLDWKMVPVNGKKPMLKDWLSAASNDDHFVAKWFSGCVVNVGIVTGKASDIICLDIDPRNKGDVSLIKLISNLGELPDTLIAKTGGGGFHYIFQYRTGLKNRKLAKGIDFLSNGRMCVVAPSIHPVTDKSYKWLSSPEKTQIKPLPESWVSFITSSKNLNISETPPKKKVTRIKEPINHRPVNKVYKGNRNDYLTWFAGNCRMRGMNGYQLKTTLLEENKLYCEPPLDPDEVAVIARSIGFKHSSASLKTRWQERLYESKLSTTEKMILIALSSYADVNGRRCYPNQADIARKSSCVRQTVAKCLKRAENIWIKCYKYPREGIGFSYGYMLIDPDEIT